MAAKTRRPIWLALLWGAAAAAAALSLALHGTLGTVPALAIAAALAMSIAALLRRRAPPPPSARGWLVETLRYYREFGFFKRFADLSDEALADQAEAMRRRETAVEFDPTDPKSDLELLALDDDRVWWKDAEIAVDAGRRAYERALPEWGRISRGAFEPDAVREEWDNPSGPLQVRFALDGTERVLRPDVDGGIGLDLEVFAEINRLIDSTGIRFEVFEPFDRTAFVVALVDVEKQRLKRERGWSFLDP
jgi:hypothetical protein